jgi:hypothetical protein
VQADWSSLGLMVQLVVNEKIPSCETFTMNKIYSEWLTLQKSVTLTWFLLCKTPDDGFEVKPERVSYATESFQSSN